MRTVEERVRKTILNQLGVSAVELDANFTEDLGADELDCVELAMGLEEEFDVELADEVVETFHTVRDVVRYFEGVCTA